jgi:hypothetical protein
MSWLNQIKLHKRVLLSGSGDRTGAVQLLLWAVDIAVIALILICAYVVADFFFTPRWEFNDWVKHDLGIRGGKGVFAAFVAYCFVPPLILNGVRKRLIQRITVVGFFFVSKYDETESKETLLALLLGLMLAAIKLGIIFSVVWIFF